CRSVRRPVSPPTWRVLRAASRLLPAGSGVPARLSGGAHRRGCSGPARSRRSARSGHSSSAAYSADRLLLFASLDQRGCFRDSVVTADHQVADNGVVEAEGVFQLGQGGAITLDIEHDVVGLVDLVDRVSQLAATPVFTAVNGTVGLFDQRSIALDHSRYLFALVRMNQEHDFIMAHCLLPMDWTAPRTAGGARSPWGGRQIATSLPKGARFY